MRTVFRLDLVGLVYFIYAITEVRLLLGPCQKKKLSDVLTAGLLCPHL